MDSSNHVLRSHTYHVSLTQYPRLYQKEMPQLKQHPPYPIECLESLDCSLTSIVRLRAYIDNVLSPILYRHSPLLSDLIACNGKAYAQILLSFAHSPNP